MSSRRYPRLPQPSASDEALTAVADLFSDAIVESGGRLRTRTGGQVITVTVPQTYTESNVTTDRTYDADTVAVAELADVVGTMVADLRAIGIFL